MDDIRRPYRGQRGDYALPAQRPHQPAPPAHQLRPHVTDLRPAPAVQAAPQPAVTHHIHQAPHHSHAQTHQPHHHPAVPHPRKKAHRPALLPVAGVILLAIAAAIGGYLLLKPHKAATFTPASLAKQASFTFYYPQPLPAGYSYVNAINTFTEGQAYYMLARGSRHIIIKEQAANSQTLDLSSLSQPSTLTTSAGKAATGTNSGQPAGLLLTSTTLVTLNSTGQVTPADISAVINSLKPTAR